MKGLIKFIIVLYGFLSCQYVVAQKPVIDSTALGKWPKLGNPKISNNGKYSAFTILGEIPILNIHENQTGVNHEIRAIIGNSYNFSADSKFLFFLKKDSLGVFNLKTSQLNFTESVENYQLSIDTNNQFLVYLNKAHFLTIQSLKDNKKQIINSVSRYIFSPDGKKIMLILSDDRKQESLVFLHVNNGNRIKVWEGEKLYQVSFDHLSKNVAFTASDNMRGVALYYFRSGNDRAHSILSQDSAGIFKNWTLLEEFTFSRKDDKLLLRLNKINTGVNRANVQYSNVNIWRYNDIHTPLSSGYYSFYGVFNLKSKKMIIPDQTKGQLNAGSDDFEDYLLLFETPQNFQFSVYPTVSVISTNTGEKTEICRDQPKRDLRADFFTLSPDDRYVVWFDVIDHSYKAFDISSKKIQDLSAHIPNALYDKEATSRGRAEVYYPIAAWDTSSRSILIYDQFDIWKISLSDPTISENITHYVGSKSGICFGIINFKGEDFYPILSPGQKLYLTAYNIDDKQNGFWTLKYDVASLPVEKTMAKCFFYSARKPSLEPYATFPTGILPLKAKNQEHFLVSRSRVDSYPNYYFTDDLAHFTAISNLHPESSYNWVTAELVNERQGKGLSGILYRPENFNPALKYPLIITYYTKRSNELNEYLYPNYTQDNIDIPMFVSNGYLIYVTDVNYSSGATGSNITDAVKTASDYLSKLPFIDSTKLGLQGFSFGGWETNFLITQSDRFAAACEGAGVSDQISSYGQIAGPGDRASSYELGNQPPGYGVGITPWLSPETYIKNSPLFFLDRISTPLLMMHGDKDQSVPFDQAIEMFLGMRRAGKKVWFLQYKNADHGVIGTDAKDYTLRVKQFFDYYLKNYSPPAWMFGGQDRKSLNEQNEFGLIKTGSKP